MALKVLMLRKKLNDANKALEALKEKDAELVTREAELEKSIEEAQTDEERSVVEEAITTYESDKAAHEEAKGNLERTIEELENDLQAEEAEQDTEPAGPEPQEEVRKDVKPMSMRTKLFGQYSAQERAAIFENENVKNWISEIRACVSEKRALSNVGLTIPDVFLGLLRQNIENYSKLYKHVGVRATAGTAREVIMGSIPEAVWTECCANLNELDLAFNDAEVDCYKVGGYFKVCNAALEDSDIDLAAEILTAIGQAIGYALDKAILYGRNTDGNSKMPLGIVSRLAQTSKPSGYSATARAWVDYHTSHVLTIANNVTGADLFKTLMLDAAVISGKYARGPKVWVMNETTYSYLKAQAMSVNAAGSIVSGFEGTMPVIGGAVEVLDFVPNYVIIGGYMDLYLLSERAGQKFAQSEHAFFLQDATAFKGTARYDGMPVIAEAFVAIGVNGTTPDATMTFAADNANTPDAIIISKSAVTVKETKTAALTATVLAAGIPMNATVTWASSDTSKATVSGGTVTGVDAGSAVVTASAGSAVAVCNVTVTT